MFPQRATKGVGRGGDRKLCGGPGGPPSDWIENGGSCFCATVEDEERDALCGGPGMSRRSIAKTEGPPSIWIVLKWRVAHPGAGPRDRETSRDEITTPA